MQRWLMLWGVLLAAWCYNASTGGPGGICNTQDTALKVRTVTQLHPPFSGAQRAEGPPAVFLVPCSLIPLHFTFQGMFSPPYSC